MATVTVSEIATNASALRAELKEWEREFAAANGGKKAGRGDIKNVPDIAAKYKEYSKLKSQESAAQKNGKAQSNTSVLEERPNKRKHSSPNGPEHGQTTSTPRKSGKGIFQTPSKKTAHPADVDPYDSPSVLRRLFSPSTYMQSTPLKTAIGPTPQRDGKALGLFDLLSESGGSTATPSANRIADIKGMTAQTPSKKRKMDTIMEEDEEDDDTARGERTPASSGKKYMLSALFATPTAWKYSSIVDDDNSRAAAGNNAAASPQPPPNPNPNASHLETPSFLRRSTSGLYNSNNQSTNPGLSPIPVRKPPQFPGKGLSQIVQGLRDMEEERLEDDLDVLREIENDAGPNVDVPDSQMPDDNASGRTFKKRGQKRTTRMVRMRPVVAPKPAVKPQSQSQPRSQRTSTPQLEPDEDYEPDDDELEAIAETQAPTSAPGNGDEEIPDPFEDNDWDSTSLHSISEAEPDAASDSDPDYDVDRKLLGRSKSFSEKMKEAIGSSGGQSGQTKQARNEQKKAKAKAQEREQEEQEKQKKPSTRKVNPNAHANYRSLKIRNRGGKAGGRQFGRFRRR